LYVAGVVGAWRVAVGMGAVVAAEATATEADAADAEDAEDGARRGRRASKAVVNDIGPPLRCLLLSVAL
jgi:hypothetical protein